MPARLPCTLESVRGALARHVHAAAEAGPCLRARPQLVELVGDVGEHDLLDARLARVLAGLARGHVAALAAALGARQRRLDEEEVTVARELDQVFCGAAVGAEHELLVALLGRDADRERLGEVRDRLERELERTDARTRIRLVLLEGERILDQVLVAPRADDAPVRLARASRRDQARAGGAVDARPAVDRHGLLARRVRERVAERDEVEEVVGVQVRDDDGVHARVVAETAQLAEHAVAAVDHDADAVLLDHVARAGAPRVLPRRRLPQNRQAHGGAILPPPGAVGVRSTSESQAARTRTPRACAPPGTRTTAAAPASGRAQRGGTWGTACR